MIRTKVVIKYLGYILLFNSLFLLISAAISFFNNEQSLNALIISALTCGVLGVLPQFFVGKNVLLNFHEGLSISVTGWFVTCIIGMLPYLIWGGEFNTVADALFESVSGYHYGSKYSKQR